MAIAPFSVGVWTTGTGALTVPWGAHLTNYVGMMFVHHANQAVATPTDWTAIESQGTGTGGSAGSVGLQMFWKRAASAAESDVSVADAGDHTFAVIRVFSGVLESGDVIDVHNGDVDAGGSALVTVPTITTTVDNAYVIGAVANATDIGTTQINSIPGFTNANLAALARLDFGLGANGAAGVWQATTGVGGGINVFGGFKAAAGAVGTTSATLVTSTLQARAICALKPQPASSSGGMLIHPGMVGGLRG